jgi:ArsR family transcriptional regulator, arsenate/arsenite/antimonite-responsive transcriptional repressor
MEMNDAIDALSALAQETRLALYRLLVRTGPKGLPAGEIASQLDANPSTVSRHLAQMERAGLVCSWRVQRQVFYAIDWKGTEALLAFLTEDCCKADPDIWCDKQSSNCSEMISRG